MRLLLRIVAVWVVLIAVEFVHGIWRALLLVPVVGDLRARQTGVLIGSALIVLVACIFINWLKAPNKRALLLAGVVWTVLTVIFEFTFGHFIFGRSWKDLTSEYDLAHQGFLGLGMVVLLLSPAIASRLCGRARR